MWTEVFTLKGTGEIANVKVLQCLNPQQPEVGIEMVLKIISYNPSTSQFFSSPMSVLRSSLHHFKPRTVVCGSHRILAPERELLFPVMSVCCVEVGHSRGFYHHLLL